MPLNLHNHDKDNLYVETSVNFDKYLNSIAAAI